MLEMMSVLQLVERMGVDHRCIRLASEGVKISLAKVCLFILYELKSCKKPGEFIKNDDVRVQQQNEGD